jgi:hypothetical protein
MKKIYPLIFLLVILLFNFSCRRPDITPAYLLLSAEDFKIDASDFNNTHDKNYDPKELAAIEQQTFTDVLVSLNGKELGYRQLPCTIPLLPNYLANNNIRVIPCVRVTNTVTTTLQYHFVTPIEEFFEMEKEQEYRLSDFKLKYVPSVKFPVLETFTQSTDFKPKTPDEFPATIEPWYDDELKKDIGRVVLSDTAVFFDVVTSYFPLQGNGDRQFWEISYKTTNGKMVALLGFEKTISGIDHYDMVVLPSTEGVWKKEYIDITNIIMMVSNTAPQVSTRLNITGIKNNPDSASYYYFENIKLITMLAPYY